MNKIFNFLILFLFISNCSLDTKTGLWSQSEKIKSENENVTEKLFEDTEVHQKEFNSELKIRLKNNIKKNSFVNNLTNNNGILEFDGKLSKISKYKFSKISQFDYYQPELLITKKNTIIFFDEKGTILNFSSNNKLIWKNNIYSKNEKKQNPILYFASNDKTLLVADSIAKYYAINLKNGELIWSNNNSAPFNSQAKIFNDKFFVVDFDNILRCYSIIDGKEIWNFKSEKSFIKSQQKLSFIINDNKLVFINTLGDLSSIDIKTGNLIWQTPTQSSAIYEDYFSLKNSDLIVENEIIFFSNNKNEFFAIDERNGAIKWKQNLNSNLRPTFSDGLVFTVTIEGYLAVIDARNGNIVRMTSVLNIIKNYKKKNNNIEILVHTNELLASGGYWVATAADEIYASYGSIIGSIGVKGPDWFFYDQPKTISTGIFGNNIETENGIKIYSNKAGKSKDIFNPFRKPTQLELEHLQNMVDGIYMDFVRIVSKERKIETASIVNDIGALIYTSNQASDLHLINKELNLDDLINKKVKQNNFENFKVIKITNSEKSLLKELLKSNSNTEDKYMKFECLSLRTSIAAILNYETTGC